MTPIEIHLVVRPGGEERSDELKAVSCRTSERTSERASKRTSEVSHKEVQDEQSSLRFSFPHFAPPALTSTLSSLPPTHACGSNAFHCSSSRHFSSSSPPFSTNRLIDLLQLKRPFQPLLLCQKRSFNMTSTRRYVLLLTSFLTLLNGFSLPPLPPKSSIRDITLLSSINPNPSVKSSTQKSSSSPLLVLDIYKPLSDQRIYSTITLSNGLKCLLVSDPTTDTGKHCEE